MFLKVVQSILKHTLCSVWFGILLMVLIASYIAIGSGLAEVREYFELDEVGFFNAWPLKLLMILFVSNLIVVTIQRIPFTPPRYGVWCIHIGMITLIAGISSHYSNKIEGRTRVRLPTPGVKTSVEHYYDRYARALYVRLGISRADGIALQSLPRFHAYDESLGNASYLDRPDLKDLRPFNRDQGKTIGELAGVPDLKLDVVGYWPYASVVDQATIDPQTNQTGVEVKLSSPESDIPQTRWLVSGNARSTRWMAGMVEVEHRALATTADVTTAVAEAKQIHHLTVQIAAQTWDLWVQVGQRYQLGPLGYAITVEAFVSDFPTTTGKTVPLIQFMVDTPQGRFRRQVLMGIEAPTDWKLNEPGAGPLGKRQTAPLDPLLKTTYSYNNGSTYLPRQGSVNYLLFTSDDSRALTVVPVGGNVPCNVQTFPDGTVELSSAIRPPGMGALMPTDPTQLPQFTISAKRNDHVRLNQVVIEVPKEQRRRDIGEAGVVQVLKIRATTKDWQGIVFVPFNQFPFEEVWSGGLLDIPGANAPISMQLGNLSRRLPAVIQLDQFEAISYAGADPSMGGTMRDFRSHLTVTDPATGLSSKEVVYLNNPFFYRGGEWLFFQSGWDNEKQQFSDLGIGNRPFIIPMLTGFILVVIGLLYAFYLKPLIIQSMKDKALQQASARSRK